jgi:hypothetical protein
MIMILWECGSHAHYGARVHHRVGRGRLWPWHVFSTLVVWGIVQGVVGVAPALGLQVPPEGYPPDRLRPRYCADRAANPGMIVAAPLARVPRLQGGRHPPGAAGKPGGHPTGVGALKSHAGLQTRVGIATGLVVVRSWPAKRYTRARASEA